MEYFLIFTISYGRNSLLPFIYVIYLYNMERAQQNKFCLMKARGSFHSLHSGLYVLVHLLYITTQQIETQLTFRFHISVRRTTRLKHHPIRHYGSVLKPRRPRLYQIMIELVIMKLRFISRFVTSFI